MTAGPISDIELGAYIDGELDPERAAAVEARLAADPALAAQVEAGRTAMARLAGLYDAVLTLPMPERAAPRPVPIRPPASAWAWPALAAAAAVALVVLATVIRREMPVPGAGDWLVTAAIAARSGGLTPDGTLDEPGLAVAADAEIEARLGRKVNAPDLSQRGWTLARVAAFTTKDGRFVELRYRDGGGKLFTISLEARSGEPETPFEVARRDGLATCIWRTDEIEAVMVGEMSVTNMLKLTPMTYDALRI